MEVGCLLILTRILNIENASVLLSNGFLQAIDTAIDNDIRKRRSLRRETFVSIHIQE